MWHYFILLYSVWIRYFEPRYVPVLRQIGAENETQMSVCEGELTGTPKVGLSYDECAASCDMVAPKASPKSRRAAAG